MNFLKAHFYFITIPPLLPLMIFFMLGIVWQASALSMLTTVSYVLLFFACYLAHKKISVTSLLWCIIYLSIGLSGGFLYKKNISEYDAFYAFAHNVPLRINGIIKDINPTLVNNKKTTLITLYVESVQSKEITKKINKYFLLYGSYDDIFVGDTVTFFDVRCKKSNNEHLNHYQIREQIIATIFNKISSYEVIHHPSWSFSRWIFNQKNKILKACEQKMSCQNFSFFTSLFLGNRLVVKKSLEDVNEQFKLWGIYHFLSRSGLHLALFIFMWQAILQRIPLPFNIKNIFVLVLSIIYALLSWSSAPFTRSFFLFLCHKTCLITKIAYNLLHYLTLVCLCFLLYCPLYLFFLDFQLTFGITFVLAWFNQLYRQYLYEQYAFKTSNY